MWYNDNCDNNDNDNDNDNCDNNDNDDNDNCDNNCDNNDDTCCMILHLILIFATWYLLIRHWYSLHDTWSDIDICFILE